MKTLLNSQKLKTALGVITAGVLMLSAGCHVSPRVMQRTHIDYNNAIHQTTSEQMLLNVVRIRYDEMPMFLQVASISTQFSVQTGIGASGTFYENVGPANQPSVLGLTGNASYTESPVVTWSLPESSEFLGKMMAPLSADQLTVLAQSGWGEERVLKIGAKKINRLRNEDFVVHEGFYTPDSFDKFNEVLSLVVQLRKDGLVDLAYGVKSSMAAGKLPIEQIDSRAIPDGIAQGVQFMTREDPKIFEPLKLSKPLFLLFSKDSDSDPRAQKLRDLLNLNPDKYSFGITDAANSGKEQLRTEGGKPTQVFDPSVKMEEIVMNCRSMMEILYFVSQDVQVPEAHLEKHWVDPGQGETDKWLKVLSSHGEPGDAWLKVKHNGYWFYIDAKDTRSREMFTLLETIFESVIGTVPGSKPLLTLPVR